jgi:Fe(3+) dicitrate transport protein
VTNYLDVGVRGVLEAASIAVLVEPVDQQGTQRLDLDSSSALQAGALFVEDQLHLLRSRLVLRAGLRAEVVHIEEDSALDPDTLEGTYWAPLPSVSVWGRPVDDLALFAAYGRSFGPPQFLQIGVAPAGAAIEPETADTVEGGIKVRPGRAVSGEITTWHSAYHDLVDVGLSSYTEVGETRASGVDADLVWALGSTWSVLEDVAVRGGYGFMTSQILSDEFEGNQLPWYPRHTMSVGASYSGPKFLADVDVRHVGPQLSDYANSTAEPADGSVGPIDEYTLVDLAAGVRIQSTSGGEVTLTLGVANLAQERWISRTDDRNRGILPQRPRTFFGTLSIRHGR